MDEGYVVKEWHPPANDLAYELWAFGRSNWGIIRWFNFGCKLCSQRCCLWSRRRCQQKNGKWRHITSSAAFGAALWSVDGDFDGDPNGETVNEGESLEPCCHSTLHFDPSTVLNSTLAVVTSKKNFAFGVGTCDIDESTTEQWTVIGRRWEICYLLEAALWPVDGYTLHIGTQDLDGDADEEKVNIVTWSAASAESLSLTPSVVVPSTLVCDFDGDRRRNGRWRRLEIAGLTLLEACCRSEQVWWLEWSIESHGVLLPLGAAC